MTDEDIVLALLDYLREVTACPALSYGEAPTRMSGGYDATILRFSLHSAPEPFTGPLVLRLFQPFNVLADNGRLTGVIDWVKATIAEPAFDYGAMIAILATVPIRAPGGVNQALRALMSNLARTLSRGCRSMPGGEAAFTYYQVFNCLVQLVTVGKSRAQGNMAQGAYNSSVGIANVREHVFRLTGIEIT